MPFVANLRSNKSKPGPQKPSSHALQTNTSAVRQCMSVNAPGCQHVPLYGAIMVTSAAATSTWQRPAHNIHLLPCSAAGSGMP
jgi:hypothetical protein